MFSMSLNAEDFTALTTEPFTGIPLQFSLSTNVAISWNDMQEEENNQEESTNSTHEGAALPGTTVDTPMTMEAIEEARQLYCSPIFVQTCDSVSQTRHRLVSFQQYAITNELSVCTFTNSNFYRQFGNSIGDRKQMTTSMLLLNDTSHTQRMPYVTPSQEACFNSPTSISLQVVRQQAKEWQRSPMFNSPKTSNFTKLMKTLIISKYFIFIV